MFPKILVVSYSLPTRASGTPVVVRKFLENFKNDEIVLIGRPVSKCEKIEGCVIPYPSYIIPTPPVGTRGERLWRFISVLLGIFIGLYAIFAHKPRLILAFYRDESSLLTGFILHKITGLPLYSYFCDLYLENYLQGVYGKLAAWLQPRIFSNSEKVLVLTEGLRNFYKEKYNIDAVVLPHCNNRSMDRHLREFLQTSPMKIGYLGSINADRIPSLKILCAAINNNDQYFLTYFSSGSKAFLHQQGLDIKNSEIVYISSDDALISELSNCDVLFLPITNFSENIEREAQAITGFPTKAIEYFICQRPILVHSKPEYFTARFFSTFHCGLVIDGDKSELTEALELLRCDPELRTDLVGNAYLVLSSYFNGYKIAQNFRELISASEA